MVKKEDYWKDPEKYKQQRREQYEKNKKKEQKSSRERQNKQYHEDESYRKKILERQNRIYKGLPKQDKETLLEKNRNRWHENYQTKYKVTHDKWYKEEHLITKTEVMKLCGNGKASCVICGAFDIDILTIDHINGREGKARKTRDVNKNHYGFPLWRKILKGKLNPLEYQTLCMNCNWKRHLNKIKKNI